ncbi:MAG TPA: hypothetical protein VKJ65_00185 [Phycisphaerae bacterium]|nr:hypothetical protein [Phycisphaerae bacterium]
MLGPLAAVLIVVLITLAAWFFLYFHPKSAMQKTAQAEPGKIRPLVVSKQNTWITSPLNSNGIPDYISALNNIAGEGATAQNNAAIPLLNSAQNTVLSNGENFRQLLVILSATPEQMGPNQWESVATYFREHLSSSKINNESAEQLLPGWNGGFNVTGSDIYIMAETDYAANRPWTAAKCPLMASYLDQVQSICERMIPASLLPRFYIPQTAELHLGFFRRADSDIWSVISVIVAPLVFRANLCLGHGDVTGCQRNLIALHHWARLFAQQPQPDAYESALWLDELATGGDQVLLSSGHLNLAQSREYLQNLESLEELPHADRSIDLGARYAALGLLADMYQNVAHISPSSGAVFPRPFDHGVEPFIFSLQPPAGLDWDWVFRQVNQMYDAAVECLRFDPYIPQGLQARQDYDHIDRRLGADIPSGNATPQQEFFVEFMQHTSLGRIFPNPIYDDSLRARNAALLTQVGFALAVYHAQNGHYPDSLDALAGEFSQRVPVNLFSGDAFSYTPSSGGYTLYANDPDMPTDPDDLRQTQKQYHLIIQFPLPAPEAWEKDKLP